MNEIGKAIDEYVQCQNKIATYESDLKKLEEDYNKVLEYESIAGELTFEGAEKVYKAFQKIEEHKENRLKNLEGVKIAKQTIIGYLKAVNGNKIYKRVALPNRIQHTSFRFHLNEGNLECNPADFV